MQKTWSKCEVTPYSSSITHHQLALMSAGTEGVQCTQDWILCQAKWWAAEYPARLFLWQVAQGNLWFALALFSRHQLISETAFADLVEKSSLSFASDLTAWRHFQTDVCLKCFAAHVRPSAFKTAESMLLFHVLWTGSVWHPLVFPPALTLTFGSLFVQMTLRCPFIPPTCRFFV